MSRVHSAACMVAVSVLAPDTVCTAHRMLHVSVDHQLQSDSVPCVLRQDSAASNSRWQPDQAAQVGSTALVVCKATACELRRHQIAGRKQVSHSELCASVPSHSHRVRQEGADEHEAIRPRWRRRWLAGGPRYHFEVPSAIMADVACPKLSSLQRTYQQVLPYRTEAIGSV